MGSLALAGAGVAEAFRAVRSHQATAESLIRDYGAFAAWTYRQRASEALVASIGTTLTPLSRVLPSCGMDELFGSLSEERECGCGARVLGAFVFRFRLSDPPGAVAFGGAPPEGAAVGRLRAAAADGVRSMEPDWHFTLVHSPAGVTGRMLAVASSRIPDAGAGSAAEDTLVFGFDVDPSRVRAILERVYLESDLLPPTLAPGASRAEVLSVALLGRDGEAVFASSGDGPHPEFAVDDALHPAFGGMVARAAVLPEAAGGLIIGGLPRSRLPYLIGLFVLAGALAVGSVRQLRKEQELARLRSDFVASVSHELRTPLAQMRLFAETLRLGRTRNDREREWFLENIENETLRLGHLVENVLQFSRSERGAGAGERRPMDLADEIRRVHAVFERLGHSNPRTGPRVVLRLEGPLPARVDGDAFRQLLLNFLDNAVKYGPRGQTITISGCRIADRIRIAVEDEGPGVVPGERERIWEPFRRGAEAVGTVAVGSGIGLAVARAAAEGQGGRTWVEDAQGGGARFVVELPASEPAPDAERAAPSEAEGAGRFAGPRESRGATVFAGAGGDDEP